MFERTLRILDHKIFENLQAKKILLVGIGGVGGSALEALVRVGFLNITIVDHDVIDKTNLNRQVITSNQNIGRLKVEEAKKRVLSINPNISIETFSIFLNEANIDEIFNIHYDYIIDACDTVSTKFLLIREAKKRNIKIISCMGTGNRMNPMELLITPLNKTYNDPLAKAMRSILRKNNLSLNVPVIWSRELPIKTNTRSPGSMMLVPTTAGMLSVYFILDDIQKTTN